MTLRDIETNCGLCPGALTDGPLPQDWDSLMVLSFMTYLYSLGCPWVDPRTIGEAKTGADLLRIAETVLPKEAK